MTTALLNGVSGLLAQQVQMDSLGNNIANANTVGFKSGRVEFADMLYQTFTPASATTQQRGGSNPSMLGAGVKVATLGTNFTQGTLQATGRNLDVAVEGNGFIPVSDGSTIFMTRNGSLGVDSDGTLIHLASKMRVLGVPTGGGAVSAASAIKLPVGQSSVAQATSSMQLTGNLDATLSTGNTAQVSATIYDSLGAAHPLTLTFTRSATANTWDVAGQSADGTMAFTGTPQIAFDANGKIVGPTLTGAFTLTNPNGAQATQNINVDLSSITQFVESGSIALASQNGLAPGSLTSVTLRDNGEVAGIFSNGTSRTVGKIATATFANIDGLENVGNTLFRASVNSGEAMYSAPGDNGHGLLRSGNLESSNVDLAREFTNMIVTQRSYQANSRVISTSDQMLEELMQIVR